MAVTFDAIVKQSQQAMEQLRKEREDVINRRKVLDNQIAELDGQLAKLQASVAALQGKSAAPAGGARRGPAPGTTRGGSTSTRMRILDLIKEHHDNGGITIPQLKERLPGVKSIDNIVSKIKKEGSIRSKGKGQPLFLAEQDEEAA